MKRRFRPGWSWALLLCAVAAAAQPALMAPLTESIELGGGEAQVDVYQPGVASPMGVAIVAHGFTRTRVRHGNLGRALAAAGVTAVIPDLPNVMDLWGNGDAVVELVGKLEAGVFGMSPVARSRIVLMGTSAGGLATVLAAARLPGIAGWIGLDPVDRTGTGADAIARLTAPAVVMLANASGCNLFGSGRTIGAAAPHLLRMAVMEGASHCDFEDPTNNFCRVICGRSSAEMQARIRDETVATVLDMLNRTSVDTPNPRVTGPADEPAEKPE